MEPHLTAMDLNTLTKATVIAVAALRIEVRDLDGVVSPYADAHRQLLTEVADLSEMLKENYPYRSDDVA